MQGNHMSRENYRLYSFVANGYLSPLQCGLQTAHAVGDMSVRYNDDKPHDHAYRTWAGEDKVIIICGAFNSGGVQDCYAELQRVGQVLGLPISIFFEDEASLNGAATACAVVVPQKYWDAKPVKDEFNGQVRAWEYIDEQFVSTLYPMTHAEGQFINHIKQYRLA
jgi:hypothetical protein